MHTKPRLALTALGLLLFGSVWLTAQGGPGGRNGTPGTGQCGICSGGTRQPLTETETRWLRYMREEEKLARDVYASLYGKWGLSIFNNISQSEQRHFDAIGILLNRYGVADPAIDQSGVFTDPTLQNLYYELMSAGQATLAGSLQVGVAIEQRDIQDLEDAMAVTKKTDILKVYSNLLSGSLNHLGTFESHLEVLGATP